MSPPPSQTSGPASEPTAARAKRRMPRLRVIALVLALAFLALGVAIRVALPAVLRSVGESQASSALGVEVRIANVDLWLLSGGLAVEGVLVGDLAATAPGDARAPSTAGPGFGIDHAFLKLRWRALADRMVSLDSVILDGLTLRARQLPGGAIEFLSAAPPESAAQPAAAAAATDTPPATPEAPEVPEAAADPAADETGDAAETAAAEPEAPAVEAEASGLEAEAPAVEADAGGGWPIAIRRLELNDVDVMLNDQSFDEPHEGAFRLEQLSLTGVELSGRRLALDSIDIEGPTLHFPPALALSVGGGAKAEPEPAQEPAAAGEPFDFGVKQLNIRRAGVFVVGDQPVDVAFHLVANEITARPNSLFPLKLDLSVGGDEGTRTLVIDGRLGLAPLAFDGRVEWSQLVLANLIAPFAGEFAPWMDSGRSSGGLDVTLRLPAPGGDGSLPDGVRASGAVRVDDLALADGGAQGEDQSLAWSSLEIDVRELVAPLGEGAGPVEIALARVALRDPAFRVTLDAENAAGDAPADDATGEAMDDANEREPAATDDAAAEANASAGVRVRIDALELSGGEVTFLDRSVRPFYRGKLEQLRISARDARWPESSVGELSLTTATSDAATITLRGKLAAGARDGDLRFELENLPLRPFNPYATRFTAYRIERGAASLHSDVRIADSRTETANAIELNDLDLTEQSAGEFKKSYGVPLQLGLALMRDVGGDIALDVPLTLGGEGASVGLGTVIRGALQRAVLTALTSPLKALGMLIPKGESIASLATSLPSVVGGAETSGEGSERIAALAQVLAGRPSLALVLRGRVGETDRPTLARQELLARADAGGDWPEIEGGGWLTRRRVRDALAAEAAGEPATLAPDDALALERWIAAVDLPASRSDDLAARRAAFVRDALLAEHGFAPERIRVAADSLAGDPGVTAELELLR
jgi:hypothetical protein